MTTITESLATYAKSINLVTIKNKVGAFASRVISLAPFPYESRIRTIARTCLETLAAALVMVTFLVALPPLLTGYFIYQSLQPSTNYVIESFSEPLTREMVLKHLRRLVESKIQFSTIEIRGDVVTDSIDGEIIGLLKHLRPKELVLPGYALSSEFVESLESQTHYYVRTATPLTPSNPQSQFELKEKIKHVVLSPNPILMVKKLQELADAKERVFKLYYTCMIPDEHADSVEKCISQIKPTIALLIDYIDKDNKDHLPAQTLESFLYA